MHPHSKSALPPWARHRAIRYGGVLYQARERVPPRRGGVPRSGIQEPWWLLVPRQSSALLPVRTVVALYRERMHVGQSIRDFKTHLGLRGLRLKVNIAERTGRLLLAFTMAYCLALLLGVSREAEKRGETWRFLVGARITEVVGRCVCSTWRWPCCRIHTGKSGPKCNFNSSLLGIRRSLPASTGSTNGHLLQRRCLKSC